MVDEGNFVSITFEFLPHNRNCMFLGYTEILTVRELDWDKFGGLCDRMR